MFVLSLPCLQNSQNYATSCMNICNYLLDFARTDSALLMSGEKIMNLLSAMSPSSRLIFMLLFRFLSHLSTAVAWIEKTCKHFVIYKYFCLVLGLLKSRISRIFFEGLGRKLDFKLFHYTHCLYRFLDGKKTSHF